MPGNCLAQRISRGTYPRTYGTHHRYRVPAPGTQFLKLIHSKFLVFLFRFLNCMSIFIKLFLIKYICTKFEIAYLHVRTKLSQIVDFFVVKKNSIDSFS